MKKIWNGDCLEVMDQISDNSVDLVLCDLPYGTTACSWDSIIPLDKLWAQYNRVVKENGAVVLTSAQPFTTTLISSNIQNFKYSLVYTKTYATQWMQAKKRPMPNHEDICVFYQKQPTYNPQMVQADHLAPVAGHIGTAEIYNAKKQGKTDRAGAKDRYPRSVLGPYTQSKKDIPKELGYKCHPTQKPLDLLKWLILTYTNEGDTVLDNCMGSGSTGVAALQTYRNFLGVEKDEHYFHMAEKWLEISSRSVI